MAWALGCKLELEHCQKTIFTSNQDRAPTQDAGQIRYLSPSQILATLANYLDFGKVFGGPKNTSRSFKNIFLII